eukprot:TRINITY_DN6941_c2_g2_i3.p1 TRINITY_DN6941_c2_g2~~TRINITY_DN6941_c2_g2_i3.p1  ORF type:complete len:1480 (-),score=51.67 TRINITY_DN6941_c2_g2_i3:202-4641(-)
MRLCVVVHFLQLLLYLGDLNTRVRVAELQSCTAFIPNPTSCFSHKSKQSWKINFGDKIQKKGPKCSEWQAFAPNEIENFEIQGKYFSYKTKAKPKNNKQFEHQSEIFIQEFYFTNKVNLVFKNIEPTQKFFVRLYFSELYFKSQDQREFDIKINGVTKLKDFDTYAEAQKDYKQNFQSLINVGITRQFIIAPEINQIIVTLIPGKLDYPHINAIELHQLPQCKLQDQLKYPVQNKASQDLSRIMYDYCFKNSNIVLRVNFGKQSSYKNQNINSKDQCGYWSPQNSPKIKLSAVCQYFQSYNINIQGYPFSNLIYQSECYSKKNNFGIQILGINPGQRYVVRLHFAEINQNNFKIGSRKFTILADNLLAVKGWDTFKIAKQGYQGVRKVFQIYAKASYINILLEKVINDIHISGIEVFQLKNIIKTINPLNLEITIETPDEKNPQKLTQDFYLYQDQQIVVNKIIFRVKQLQKGFCQLSDNVYITLPSELVVKVSDKQYILNPFIILSTILVKFQISILTNYASCEGNRFNFVMEFYSDNIAIHIVHVFISLNQNEYNIQEPSGQLERTQQTRKDTINSHLLGNTLLINHTLHPIIRAKCIYIDWNDDGARNVFLDGSDSHTHSDKYPIINRQWKNVFTNKIISQGINQIHLNAKMVQGENQVSLTLADAVDRLTTSVSFQVAPPHKVPGILVLYYEGKYNINQLQFYSPYDVVRIFNDFIVKVSPLYQYENYHIRMLGYFRLNQFVKVKIFVKPQVLNSLIEIKKFQKVFMLINLQQQKFRSLEPALYQIDFRAKVHQISQNNPLQLVFEGLPKTINIYHNETNLAPIIRKLTENFAVIQQENVHVKIDVESYNPYDFSVYIDKKLLPKPNIVDVSDDYITIKMPKISKPTIKQIYVKSKGLLSNVMKFKYLSAENVPIKFIKKIWKGSSKYKLAKKSAVLTWCHGKLYTATAYEGIVQEHTFDHNYNYPQSTTILDLKQRKLRGDKQEFNPGNSNRPIGTSILGIVCDPSDSSNDYRIYISHSTLYGIKNRSMPYPYQSYISEMRSSNWKSTFRTIVYNLPTSGIDHAVNGLDLDGEGNLIIAVGGMTNAGVASPQMGSIPESYFSGAIVKCPVHDANFDGYIQYEWWMHTANDIKQKYSVYDQRVGDWVCQKISQSPNTSCFVYASGVRNPFGVVYTQNGDILSTDNGPNKGYGATLVGPKWTKPIIDGNLMKNKDGTFFKPTADDELNLIVKNGYYGHPNTARGRCLQDPRQFKYRPPTHDNNPPHYRAPLTSLTSSSDGITQYKAQTFNGAIRGDFFISKFKASMYQIRLSKKGENDYYVDPQNLKNSADIESLPNTECLDVEHCPGGTLICVKYEADKKSFLEILVPQDQRAQQGQIVMYDIFPWRVPLCSTGKEIKFEIRGDNFNKLQEPLSVIFGGKQAQSYGKQVKIKNKKVITGYFPCFINAPKDMVDVTITDRSSKTIQMKNGLLFFKW